MIALERILIRVFAYGRTSRPEFGSDFGRSPFLPSFLPSSNPLIKSTRQRTVPARSTSKAALINFQPVFTRDTVRETPVCRRGGVHCASEGTGETR